MFRFTFFFTLKLGVYIFNEHHHAAAQCLLHLSPPPSAPLTRLRTPRPTQRRPRLAVPSSSTSRQWNRGFLGKQTRAEREEIETNMQNMILIKAGWWRVDACSDKTGHPYFRRESPLLLPCSLSHPISDLVSDPMEARSGGCGCKAEAKGRRKDDAAELEFFLVL